jgi:hypothetical protein
MSYVTLSASGQYQTGIIGGLIYTSNNYGVTWNLSTDLGSISLYAASLSASGQYQTVGADGNYIYISSDFGVTWSSAVYIDGVIQTNTYNWYPVSISASGQYQTAFGWNNQYIYISSDFGNSWSSSVYIDGLLQNQSGSEIYNLWESVAVSASGQYQTINIWYNGYIYISSNYGKSWSSSIYIDGLLQNQSGNEVKKNWLDVSISASGQ